MLLTYNLAGVSQEALPELLRTLTSHTKWDVLALQEAGRNKDDFFGFVEGHYVFIARAMEGSRSVGLVVHRDWAQGACNPQVRWRTASIDLFLGKVRWRFITTH